MMKSALFRSYFRESAVGVSGYMRKQGISLRSLSDQSHVINSRTRQTPLSVNKVLALFCNAKMRVVPRKLCFSVPILERESGLYFYLKLNSIYLKGISK